MAGFAYNMIDVGYTSTYDCAVNYQIRHNKDKVILLGTNGSMNEYEHGPGSEEVLTTFGVYYTHTEDPKLSSLSFLQDPLNLYVDRGSQGGSTTYHETQPFLY